MSLYLEQIGPLVAAVSEKLLAHKLMISTAESCTGGMIAAAITDRAGATQIFDRGVVTYSYQSKTDLLHVDSGMICREGAVSHACASAMTTGLLTTTHADCVLVTTGIAGPTGGSPEKPVGLVFIAFARRGHAPVIEQHIFPGDRTNIREAAVLRALNLTLENII